MKQDYNYSEIYYKGLTNRWNKLSYPIITKFVNNVFSEYPTEYILDLGCGSGIYFDLFRKRTKKIYGVDISEQSKILCQKKGYIQVKIADASAIPFQDATFDFVFTSEVLEHIENYLLMLQEINRVLKPNGILFLTTTCYSTAIFTFLKLYKGSFQNFLKEIYIYISGFRSKEKRTTFVRKWCFESLGGHFHGFKPNSLKRDISDAGLLVLEIKTFYVIPPIPISPKLLVAKSFSRNIKYSPKKRLTMFFTSLLLLIMNPLLRFFKIWANNVYVIAQKE